jgi:hypothetical protein
MSTAKKKVVPQFKIEALPKKYLDTVSIYLYYTIDNDPGKKKITVDPIRRHFSTRHFNR